MPRRSPRANRSPRRRGRPRSARSLTTRRTPIPRTTSRRTSRSGSSSRFSARRKGRSSATSRSPSARSPICSSGLMTAHLKAFLQFLRLNRNASAHTVRAYETDLAQFLSHAAAASGVRVGDLSPAQLDRQAIRGFLAELHKVGQSRASTARKLASIRTFLRYLRREEVIEDDPGALVATPKRDVRMPAHLSEGEMEALLDAPPADSPLGRRDLAILELFYASGLRLSELVGVDLDDVDLGSKRVRVVGKGGKERIVPFNQSTAKAVRAYLRDRDSLVSPGPAKAGHYAEERAKSSGAVKAGVRSVRLQADQK